MVRILVVSLLLLVLAGCTVSNQRLASPANFSQPPSDSKFALVQPDVSLGLLGAVGYVEPRKDWSDAARANLIMALSNELTRRGHAATTISFDAEGNDRIIQILHLNEAVGQSIQTFSYGLYSLPTKKGFDWTLGEGARAVRDQHGADFALFINAKGSYASSGRVATMIGAALLGVSVPLGGQTVQASLVELSTGRIVWYNLAVAGPNADMREAAGANALVASLMEKAPL
jgi:hypothetical protein